MKDLERLEKKIKFLAFKFKSEFEGYSMIEIIEYIKEGMDFYGNSSLDEMNKELNDAILNDLKI